MAQHRQPFEHLLFHMVGVLVGNDLQLPIEKMAHMELAIDLQNLISLMFLRYLQGLLRG